MKNKFVRLGYENKNKITTILVAKLFRWRFESMAASNFLVVTRFDKLTRVLRSILTTSATFTNVPFGAMSVIQ